MRYNNGTTAWFWAVVCWYLTKPCLLLPACHRVRVCHLCHFSTAVGTFLYAHHPFPLDSNTLVPQFVLAKDKPLVATVHCDRLLANCVVIHGDIERPLLHRDGRAHVVLDPKVTLGTALVWLCNGGIAVALQGLAALTLVAHLLVVVAAAGGARVWLPNGLHAKLDTASELAVAMVTAGAVRGLLTVGGVGTEHLQWWTGGAVSCGRLNGGSGREAEHN